MIGQPMYFYVSTVCKAGNYVFRTPYIASSPSLLLARIVKLALTHKFNPQNHTRQHSRRRRRRRRELHHRPHGQVISRAGVKWYT